MIGRAPTFASLLVAALAGCSITVDDGAPTIALTDTPAPLPAARIAKAASETVAIVDGADGRTWVALYASSTIHTLRLIPIDDPAGELAITAGTIVIARRTLFLVDVLAKSTRVGLYHPGAPGPVSSVDLTHGAANIFPAPTGDRWLYWAGNAPSYQILDGNGAVLRDLPADYFDKNAYALPFLGWTHAGDRFFTLCARTAPGPFCDHLIAHPTDGASDLDLGPLDGQMAIDDDHRAAITCDASGLRSVPWDGSAARVLDPDPCAALPEVIGNLPGLTDDKSAWRAYGNAYYWVGSDPADARLRSVPLDGSAPPSELLQGKNALLALGPNSAAYAIDRASFAYATDGWMTGARFMERGRDVLFSKDGRHLRWLEGTARALPVGSLLSAPSSGGDSIALALNVSGYHEASDGRIVASANLAFQGAQNQVIVIDEDRRTAQVIADGADDFYSIPDSDDLLVELVTGDADEALVHLALPPRL